MYRFALAAFLLAAPALAQEPTEPEYVAVTELESRKADMRVLITKITLRHAAPQVVIDKVAAALAVSDTKATMAIVGGKVLVQGPGPAVYTAYTMARLIDGTSSTYVQVVPLKHAAPTTLIKALKLLIADSVPSVRFRAHKPTNALLITGPQAVVEDAVAVATALDDLAKK